MTVSPLGPVALPGAADAAADVPAAGAEPGGFAAALGSTFASASHALERADGAERAFVAGRGGLQEMVLERAQADIAVQIASTAASHATQALSTILGMQI